MRIEINLSRGEKARIFGPASLQVHTGRVVLLGAELAKGDSVRIADSRSYTLKSEGDSLVEVILEGYGRVEAPRDEEEPIDEWIYIADTILDECDKPCVITVIGPVDAGKTSFSALVSNRALSRNVLPAIVDADIGQADIGPPGFISLGMPDTWITWLRELEPVAMRFIGSIEPGPVAGRILASVASLVNEGLLRGAGVVIIDTDGWVSGWSAVEYKLDLVRLVKASHVVVMGDIDLYRFVERSVSSKVYYARSPLVYAERDVSDRRRLRSENYQKYIGGESREVDLTKVSIHGSCLLSGSMVSDESIYRISREALKSDIITITRYPGGLCILVDSDEQPDTQTIKSLQRKLGSETIVIHRGGMTNILAALSGPDGNDYPALLESVDLDSMKALFKTRYTGPVVRVIFGRIRLTPEYREEGARRLWI
ncbi:MAG: hypothetical protein GSR85_06615 [Desulfurococcales archaeon]|nr:hypothetical protein [Desulfurococcales archaeon]